MKIVNTTTACMAAALVVVAQTLPAAWANEWTVLPESRLGFTATQSGAEFDGVFERFDATMVFDPSDLAASGFDVTIDVTSFNSQSRDRDSTVPKKAWFHFSAFPESTFVTSAVRETAPGAYEADATLTIKGVSQAVTLPFTWEIDGDAAVMDGEVTLNRNDFNVGTGQWRSGKTVGTDVTVHVDLMLLRSN